MPTEDIKRKLAAIFSADVEGYSRLMEGDELATVQTLTSYKETMRKLITNYRGRVVDSTGDNLLAEFASVVDAVQCAVEVQQILKVKNEDLPENRKMLFRIGINLGDVIEEGDRIFGDGVNIAARIESLADGGGICISGTAYDHIKNKLALAYNYLGEHSVKNISDPVRVYKVPMDPKDVGKRKGVKPWKRAAVAAAVVVILAGAAALIWHYHFRPPPIEPASEEKMAHPLPDKPSIAVMPFANISGDPKEDYLSDGITDAIITGLSKTPEMFVIARNSVFTYKGKPVKVKQVSEDLGVRYVLEGSVQKQGDRLRINAQLIDAIKGHHLWAEKYDRDLKDLFALQDEITMKIIESLQLKLTEGSYARVLARGTDDIEAYLEFLQAIQIFRRFTKEDNFRSRKMFEEVISLDPKYPMPYIYLGFTHLVDVRFGWSKSPKEDLARAKELARKALELDDSLGMPHRLLADIHIMKKQWDKAFVEAERAVSINPTAMNMYGLAFYQSFAGRPEEAIGWLKKAFRLDPIPPAVYLSTLGFNYFLAERYENALAEYKRALRKGGYSPKMLHRGLAATCAMLGQEEKARDHVEELLRIDPKYSLEDVTAWFKRNFKNPTVGDRYIAALRKAGLPENPPLALPDKPSIAVLPFDNLSADPEQEYFSDGMTDTLITDLSKISGLFVIARNSVFTYKGKTVKVDQIGRELGVRYVLEGSVQRAGNQVRINAQLIDTTKGGGGHLWADRYDGEMDNIFGLQDEIIGKIVSALAVKLTDSEQKQVAWKGTDNIGAYDALLKGWGHYLRFTEDDMPKAVSNLKKAIELDPNYGRAYAMLGRLYLQTPWLWLRDKLGIRWPMGRLMARKYLDLAMKNPGPDAHQLAADMKRYYRLYDEAIDEAKRALTLAPNNPHMHGTLAKVLIYAGRPKEGAEYSKYQMRHDPRLVQFSLYRLGLAHFSMGEYEQAATYFERSLEHNSEAFWNFLFLAATYAHLGREKKANEALENYFSMLGGRRSIRYIMYWYFWKDPEVNERFDEGLKKAGVKPGPSGYYKTYEENRLSGDEIKELVFGRETMITSRQITASVSRTKDGTIMEGDQAVGKSRIDGDMLCDKWDYRFEGLEYCGTVFRNPEGTPDAQNEYLYVTEFQTCGLQPLSVE